MKVTLMMEVQRTPILFSIDTGAASDTLLVNHAMIEEQDVNQILQECLPNNTKVSPSLFEM